MEKPVVKVAFMDFWDCFNPEENFFMDALRLRFTPVVDEKHPDFVFYSTFGLRHLAAENCVKIFYSGENVDPDFNQCDFAITTSRLSYANRHLYLPAYTVYYGKVSQADLPPLTPEMAKRKFCSFLYSNENFGEGSRVRKDFCRRLMSEYAHVDCPGKVLHNVDVPELAARGDMLNWNHTKRTFLGNYKFNIAFENTSNHGYITEKLMDCYLGNTVPIYWGSEGNPGDDIPRDSLICAQDYPTTEALIARIREVNENDELYLAMLAANPLRHGMTIDPDAIISDFLAHVIARGNHPFDKDLGQWGDAAKLSALSAFPPSMFGLRLRLLLLKVRARMARGASRATLQRRKQQAERALGVLRRLSTR